MSRDVQTMFGGIAARYDRTNTVLSLGVHHGWRRKAVSGSKGLRVLDVATGTGDLANGFARQGADVVGLDFARPMVEVAAGKREGDWLVGDALALPFGDDGFDVASIAFGIRNVDDPVAGLREMARVVRPGGRIVVLEFGQPRGPIGIGYRFYSRYVMPRVGGWITGDRAAYEYLPRTAATFPAGTAFLALMEQACLKDARARRLTGGIAWLYTAGV